VSGRVAVADDPVRRIIAESRQHGWRQRLLREFKMTEAEADRLVALLVWWEKHPTAWRGDDRPTQERETRDDG
jgi:hypothetical protein